MGKDTSNNVKLGVFLSAGILILIISLYLIGKNNNFFGSNFEVRARFNNISGLLAGNNVRFSGIQAGTVSKIKVINDTTIEVTLLIEEKMKPFIHQNSYVAIGNDGLMGNKVINITPNPVPSPEIEEGGLLATKSSVSTDDMLSTLSNTNNNIEVISENLKYSVIRLNKSTALWNLLDDTSLLRSIHISMANVQAASVNIKEVSETLNEIAGDAQNGKGTVGMLLSDEKTASSLKLAIENINKASRASVSAITQIDSLMYQVRKDVNSGNNAAHAILKDSTLAIKLNNSVSNIEKGTEGFNQNMEALKHNFLTRGYFRKKAKQEKKAAK